MCIYRWLESTVIEHWYIQWDNIDSIDLAEKSFTFCFSLNYPFSLLFFCANDSHDTCWAVNNPLSIVVVVLYFLNVLSTPGTSVLIKWPACKDLKHRQANHLLSSFTAVSFGGYLVESRFTRSGILLSDQPLHVLQHALIATRGTITTYVAHNWGI